MKRMISLLLVSVLLLSLAACGSDETTAPAPETTPDPEVLTPDMEFDVDFSQMEENMRYPEMTYILGNPEEFIDKTIKLEGYFYLYESDIRNVYVCLVEDITGCCAQGLEFRLAGEHKFPDDYPASDEYFTVTGVFEPYWDDEDEVTKYELVNASLYRMDS
jgi:predicted small lipoprotein YifL